MKKKTKNTLLILIFASVLVENDISYVHLCLFNNKFDYMYEK